MILWYFLKNNDNPLTNPFLFLLDCQGVFLIYSSDLMYVLTELRYVLICQVKKKEKYVVSKMLL